MLQDAQQIAESGRLRQAIVILNEVVAKNPGIAEAHTALAMRLLDCGDALAATEALGRALQLDPENAALQAYSGRFFASCGAAGKAADHYRKAITIQPHCGDAHYGLALLPEFVGKDDLSRMEAAFSAPDTSEHERMLVAFALGKVFDGLQQFDKAFEFAHEANRLQRKSLDYSIDEQKKLFSRHRDGLNRGFLEQCRDHAAADNTPILVLGMPRSGSTLVEQILASHPLVYGAGEVEHVRVLVDGVRKLTGKPFPQNISDVAPEVLRELSREYVGRLRTHCATARHVVDKLPHNFLRIGLFAAVLPNAKIIECRRNPLDNCWSIYQHYFAAEHGYASDLDDLGRYYGLYEDMMIYWQQLFPGHVYRIHYERLVTDLEAQTRALLEFCELSFHEDCVAFHKSGRVVSTPSASQVRQPVYQDALGRSRNYEKYLQPLAAALARN